MTHTSTAILSNRLDLWTAYGGHKHISSSLPPLRVLDLYRSLRYGQHSRGSPTLIGFLTYSRSHAFRDGRRHQRINVPSLSFAGSRTHELPSTGTLMSPAASPRAGHSEKKMDGRTHEMRAQNYCKSVPAVEQFYFVATWALLNSWG